MLEPAELHRPRAVMLVDGLDDLEEAEPALGTALGHRDTTTGT